MKDRLEEMRYRLNQELSLYETQKLLIALLDVIAQIESRLSQLEDKVG